MTRTRTVGWLVISILVFVGFGIYGAIQANIYFNGEAVSAHVDSCETHRVYSRHGSRQETTCRGSWKTSDGRSHSGKIDGAVASDDDQDVKIRADGDTAIMDSRWELWPLGVAGVGLILILITSATVRAAWRRTGPGFGGGGRPRAFGRSGGSPSGFRMSGPPGQGFPSPGYQQPGYQQPGYPANPQTGAAPWNPPQGPPGQPYPPGTGGPPPGYQQGPPPGYPRR